MSSDSISVHITECAVELQVGSYAHERGHTQTVIVSVEASSSLTNRYDVITNADIATIIDYERLYDFITATLPTLGHIPFLESIAQRIADFCFEDRRITKVRVHLDKPGAFAGKAMAGITLQRKRKEA
jgi:dihydroneopterin aldolase